MLNPAQEVAHGQPALPRANYDDIRFGGFLIVHW
jgi:hypothetical protein